MKVEDGEEAVPGASAAHSNMLWFLVLSCALYRGGHAAVGHRGQENPFSIFSQCFDPFEGKLNVCQCSADEAVEVAFTVTSLN